VSSMRIERYSLISGARRARGLAVVIDVFRAFTTATYVMANGAERIIPVGSLEETFELKRLHPDWVLMGERGGARVEGFDFGNSPFEIKSVDFTGKTVIQTTGAGTQGVVNAVRAEEILLGSFVIADAIVRYIRRAQPKVVSLVAMGSGGAEPSEEDELCARYIEKSLNGRMLDFNRIKRRVKASPSGAKFFDLSQPQYHEQDFYMALELSKFDFVLGVVKNDGLFVVKEHS